jgi:RNA polymerase sigma-70 factor (ECF subfamily)
LGSPPGGDAAVEAELRLALAEVSRAIAALSPEQRAVLLLVSVEGVAYREAAEIVELPIGTVMSRLAHARLALGQALDAPRQRDKTEGEGKSGSTKVIKLG